MIRKRTKTVLRLLFKEVVQPVKTIPQNVIAGPLRRYRMIKYVLHKCDWMLSEKWKRNGLQIKSLEPVLACLDKVKLPWKKASYPGLQKG